MASRSLLDSVKSGSEQVFHESDYHTPRRKRAILSRNSSALACLIGAIFVVTLILLITTVAVRFESNNNEITFKVTLGDSQLISINSYFCEDVEMITVTEDAPVTMYLLKEQPPLDSVSNVIIPANFTINNFKEYIEEYGWYDYEDYTYTININYVTWSFQLYNGSNVTLKACTDDGNDASFIFIQSKNNYYNFMEYEALNGKRYEINSCPQDQLLLHEQITENDRYYFIFQATTNKNPVVNLTLSLNRTEYTVNDNGINCTSPTCTLPVPLGEYKYVLLQTQDTLSTSLQYGSRIQFIWNCIPRQWIYIVIFFIPLIFCCTLFISMYFIFLFLNKRKLASYEALNLQTNNAKFLYNKPI